MKRVRRTAVLQESTDSTRWSSKSSSVGTNPVPYENRCSLTYTRSSDPPTDQWRPRNIDRGSQREGTRISIGSTGIAARGCTNSPFPPEYEQEQRIQAGLGEHYRQFHQVSSACLFPELGFGVYVPRCERRARDEPVISLTSSSSKSSTNSAVLGRLSGTCQSQELDCYIHALLLKS